MWKLHTHISIPIFCITFIHQASGLFPGVNFNVTPFCHHLLCTHPAFLLPSNLVKSLFMALSEPLFMWRSQRHLTLVLRRALKSWCGSCDRDPNILISILTAISTSLYEAFLKGTFDPHMDWQTELSKHTHTPIHTTSQCKQRLFTPYSQNIHPTHSFSVRYRAEYLEGFNRYWLALALYRGNSSHLQFSHMFIKSCLVIHGPGTIPHSQRL